MSRRGDPSHDHKRLRIQASSHNQRRRPKFSTVAKAKYVLDKGQPILFVRIISAVDIDRDFRSITHNRFYGVQGWIHPGEEYRTQAIRPRFYNMDLDPVWDELLSMPLRQTSLEDATLHLDVLRASAAAYDPGTSATRKLVGRVQLRLDQLEPDRVVRMRLGLMQPAEFGWKPEGHISLAMQLRFIPTEEVIDLTGS